MPAIPAAPPAVTISFAPQAAHTQQGMQEGQSLNLQPSEIVQATVVEGGMDTVELELGRIRLKAHTRVPLRTGQRLQMQVQNTSPQVELKILNQNLLESLFQRLHLFGEDLDLGSRLRQILGEIATSAGRAPSSQQAAESLSQALNQFLQRPDGGILQALAGMLGLDTEALLADRDQEGRIASLKTLLLHLTGQQQENSTLQQQSGKLLQHLELMQLCQVRLHQDNAFFLPLPLPFLERGFALLERRFGKQQEEGEEQEPQGYSISLCLRLQHLGPLEIRMLYEEPQLLVRVLCRDQKAADFFSGLGEEFKEAVEALPVYSLTVTTGARDPDRILMEKVLPESEHFVERTV
jgi:hypothetical protein